MSKAVLMSIQPYFVFLIIARKMGWSIDKEKTVEVRKTFPKDENWDKVVKMYCSKNKRSFSKIPKEYQPLMKLFLGRVIGEFVCEGITIFEERNGAYYIPDFILKKTCLTEKELWQYGQGKELNFLGISDLVIYDKPKELGEFKTVCTNFYNGEHCEECEYFIDGRGYEYDESDCGCDGLKPIERPPQSWLYCEELGA